jgi:hypothetical protein
MSLPTGQAPFDCVEVRFKTEEKSSNTEKLTLSMGDIVATVASPGHDIVTLTGGGENPNEEKRQILTVTRFLKSTEKHHRKTLTSGLRHEKKEPMKVRARECHFTKTGNENI